VTLVELAVACAAALVLAAVALPPLLQPLQQARRGEAAQALQLLQAAQEAHRVAHGRYADSLQALRRPDHSAHGHWRLELMAGDGAQPGYRARAVPASTPWYGADPACPELLLSVARGFPTRGPSARCWNL
jgi:type II secretory pathway pseudopilin PulG